MKGLGIILMIVVHTLGPESPVSNFIHTSNMPMFFMVAGFFAKEKATMEILTSSYNRLIKPFFFICFGVVLFKLCQHYYQSRTLYIDINGILNCMGPGWFLLALFWGRLIFNYLISFFPKFYLIPAFIISSIPIFLNRFYPIWIPLGVLQGFSCVVFIALGYYVKKHNILKIVMNYDKIFLVIALLCWLNTGLFGKVEMADSCFQRWIIDYIGAIGGVILYYFISRLIVKYSKILTPMLLKISFYSLAILAFHAIDFCLPLWYRISYLISQEFMVGAVLIGRFIIIYLCILVTSNNSFLYQLFTGKPKNSQIQTT